MELENHSESSHIETIKLVPNPPHPQPHPPLNNTISHSIHEHDQEVPIFAVHSHTQTLSLNSTKHSQQVARGKLLGHFNAELAHNHPKNRPSENEYEFIGNFSGTFQKEHEPLQLRQEHNDAAEDITEIEIRKAADTKYSDGLVYYFEGSINNLELLAINGHPL